MSPTISRKLTVSDLQEIYCQILKCTIQRRSIEFELLNRFSTSKIGVLSLYFLGNNLNDEQIYEISNYYLV